MQAAPIHLAKLEFRLEEDNLASLLKEMDREITNQHQMLNRKEDSQEVLSRHITLFEKGKIPSEAKACLEKLLMMESRYTVQHPEDTSLKEQFAQAKQAFNTINDRVKNLRVLLEEIPVQLNEYKAK
jgi:DNA repair ATPase RecN